MPFANPHPLYSVWMSMKNRCRHKSFPQWKDYGGRGISVCERWQNSFDAWLQDMGPRPDGYVLDRINNDGNYEPGNCRWTDRSTSQRNTRVVRIVHIDGKTYKAADLADLAGVKVDTIVYRAALGMSYDQVISSEPHANLTGLALGGKASGAKRREKKFCIRGHDMTGDNAAITKEGWRRCRICHAYRENLRRKAK
jgi:hypothetical protein